MLWKKTRIHLFVTGLSYLNNNLLFYPMFYSNRSGSVSYRLASNTAGFCCIYTLFIRRMQSLGFYSRLLGPVSPVLTNRVSKG